MFKLSYNEVFSAILAITITCAGVAHSQTWVCDTQAATGFKGSEGFRALNFTTNRSYTIKNRINPDDLSFDFQKNDNIFQRLSDDFTPASIQATSDRTVELCEMFDGKILDRSSAWISCDLVYYGDEFFFNLNTGRFSLYQSGFENGNDSIIEVGDCRRTQ